MNTVLAPQLGEVLSQFSPKTSYEGPLRVAAATLAHANSDINATTVTGLLGGDDVGKFQDLLADIAQEFDLGAQFRRGVGTFSVRFTRDAS
jgi:hypothetical protein